MIQYARQFDVPLPSSIDDDDCTAWDTDDENEVGDTELDTSLDYLLKYALKSGPGESDAEHAWQRLSKRVQGPFGTAALEAPCLSSIEAELLTSGGRIQQAPFVLNDKVENRARLERRSTAIDSLWEMLRPDVSGRSHGGCAWMLS